MSDIVDEVHCNLLDQLNDREDIFNNEQLDLNEQELLLEIDGVAALTQQELAMHAEQLQQKRLDIPLSPPRLQRQSSVPFSPPFAPRKKSKLFCIPESPDSNKENQRPLQTLADYADFLMQDESSP